MAVFTQVFRFTMRKSDSYTVAIYEFWGQRGLRRRRGEGEGKIRTPQQRLGESLEKHGNGFVKINLIFTCHFTRIDCEVGLVTLTIWTSTSGSKKRK